MVRSKKTDTVTCVCVCSNYRDAFLQTRMRFGT